MVWGTEPRSRYQVKRMQKPFGQTGMAKVCVVVLQLSITQGIEFESELSYHDNLISAGVVRGLSKRYSKKKQIIF